MAIGIDDKNTKAKDKYFIARDKTGSIRVHVDKRKKETGFKSDRAYLVNLMEKDGYVRDGLTVRTK